MYCYFTTTEDAVILIAKITDFTFAAIIRAFAVLVDGAAVIV